jgi:Holliday junction DNA helicase RuvA
MIAHLNGTVARIEANYVVVDVNGVGYRVVVPISALSSLPEAGGKAMLYIAMIVREDDISLYGFLSLADLQVFQIVTGVTGVGPKVALSMLSVMDAGELARSIAGNDVKALTRVPGVGPKLAQRIILELGERMAEFSFTHRVDSAVTESTARENAAYEDVVEALVNLGYSRPDSRKAAERAITNSTDKSNTGILIRDALNLLSSRGRQ